MHKAIITCMLAGLLLLQLIKANDLKHQVTELTLRLQEQKTQQTEQLEQMGQGLQGLQVQLEGANAQSAELQKTNDELRKQVEELKLKKNKPVTIASASRDGATQALTGYEVTWYNNEGISGITASGKPTRDGITVSADPRVLPLGTRIKIVMPDGTEYIRTVEDTGSAVKGRILDVYASASRTELLRRGRTKNATVIIL